MKSQMSIKAMSFIFLLTVIFCTGCGRDEIINDPVITNTPKGAYVLSEGSFTPGTSKLSFYNRTSEVFSVSIFNPGNLGITPDGLISDGSYLYITEQGSGSAGKIYRTDTNGTVISTGNAGTSPYSLAAANEKIYVTNGPSNSVSVIDKSSLAVLRNISTGLYPQEIIAIGNSVFVCNTSVFGGGTDSTVTVIDAVSDLVTATIQVGKNPSSLTVTNDGMLLIGCPGDSSAAAIYKVDPSTNNILFVFRNLNHGFCKDIAVVDNNKICFIGGDIYSESGIEIYNMSTGISTTVIPKPSNGLNYGLAFDRDAQLIYTGFTVSNFSSSGKFRVFDINGSLKQEYNISTSTSSGIAPRRILVKY